MHEVVPVGVDLLKCFTAALRQYEMTRFAVAGLDRLVPIGSDVLAVMAAEASVPILVSNKIGIRPPIDFHFREKSLTIDCLGLVDDRIRLRGAQAMYRNFVLLCSYCAEAGEKLTAARTADRGARSVPSDRKNDPTR